MFLFFYLQHFLLFLITVQITVSDLSSAYKSENGVTVTCSSEYACVVEEDNLLAEIPEVSEEVDCQDLCAGTDLCTFYTWYGDTSSPPSTCYLFSSCLVTDTTCSGCLSGPPACSETGILISGGMDSANSVEVFVPSTGHSCSLTSLPPRAGHTMDSLYICGGDDYFARDSCIQFLSGQWTSLATLQEYRDDHSSWLTPQGLVLMGGDYSGSEKSTEIVTLKGGQGGPGFTLKFEARGACTIPAQNSVIVTGGEEVTRYGLEGYMEDLPRMNKRRQWHGCGSYLLADGTQVLLVAGGWNIPNLSYLSSTELLTVGSTVWTMATPLPRAVSNLAGVSLGNKVYMTGGHQDHEQWPDILEWDAEDSIWRKTGEMKVSRQSHAATSIELVGEVMEFCN